MTWVICYYSIFFFGLSLFPFKSVSAKPSRKIESETKLFCFDIDNKQLIFWGFFLNDFFFKIESWNFQDLFEIKFHETSQNVNSIRQLIEKMKITIVWMIWMSWNFVRFHEILFQTDTESLSCLSWKTKYFLSRCL